MSFYQQINELWTSGTQTRTAFRALRLLKKITFVSLKQGEVKVSDYVLRSAAPRPVWPGLITDATDNSSAAASASFMATWGALWPDSCKCRRFFMTLTVPTSVSDTVKYPASMACKECSTAVSITSHAIVWRKLPSVYFRQCDIYNLKVFFFFNKYPKLIICSVLAAVTRPARTRHGVGPPFWNRPMKTTHSWTILCWSCILVELWQTLQHGTV